MSELIHDAPWLVAVWPGMGSVAALAGAYLVGKLGAEPVARLSTHSHFEVEAVEVADGLLKPPRMPRVVIYRWTNPAGPDLLISVSQAQPARGAYALSQELIDLAYDLGARRVATFAAMAAPVSPQAPARVFAVATEPKLLADALRQEDVSALDSGSISGLNGVLLAAGQARGLPGICLLGEFPFFASALPQPKAAAAVLRAFRQLAGVSLGLDELEEQGQAVERKLTSLLEQVEERGGSARLSTRDSEAEVDLAPRGARLEPSVIAHIEALFAQAERDRSHALALKALLDEHEVFRAYEDRFLDLFKTWS